MNSHSTGRVLITGAAGNLGGLLARYMLENGFQLRLMVHQKPLPNDLDTEDRVEVVTADLDDPESLVEAVSEVDVVVHFAGVLFAPRPEKFLPTTNTVWFQNLLTAAISAGVSKVVLISFPHVEGESTIEAPATGRLDGMPNSVHARTRLEEEKLLVSMTEATATIPTILRLGMVYGRGVLMIDAARWLSARNLLAVWKEPTWIHLLSREDFVRATRAAVERPLSRGIYHVGDESPVTLQEFLDRACDHWGTKRPWRFPLWIIYSAAFLCELYAAITGSASPLTRDFVTIGRQSYFGDTGRTREELVSTLVHPDLTNGLETL